MTIKKCSKCGREDDFSEKPLCDKCAVETYSSLLLFNLIGELQSSDLKPKGELKRIINKLKEEQLNKDYWEKEWKKKKK